MKVLPGKTTINWSECKSYEDILFHKSDEGIARIAINRPEKRNAFRPQTVDELIDAFDIVRNDETIGVVLFTGAIFFPRKHTHYYLLRRISIRYYFIISFF